MLIGQISRIFHIPVKSITVSSQYWHLWRLDGTTSQEAQFLVKSNQLTEECSISLLFRPADCHLCPTSCHVHDQLRPTHANQYKSGQIGTLASTNAALYSPSVKEVCFRFSSCSSGEDGEFTLPPAPLNPLVLRSRAMTFGRSPSWETCAVRRVHPQPETFPPPDTIPVWRRFFPAALRRILCASLRNSPQRRRLRPHCLPFVIDR